jgi:hypothetical protein
LWLDAGYGVTLMADVTADPSVFDPKGAKDCADSGGNLDSCGARQAGQARPTAAGRYGRIVHDLGLGLAAKF